VSVGPSYQSKRQESVASIMALVSSYPQIMQSCGDLLVGQMDWPMAKQIAERLKIMLPPQLQDDDETDPQVKMQKLQATLQQMAKQHELLEKALNETTDKLKTDWVKQQANVEIHKLDNETKIAIAEISTKAQIAIERAKTVQGVWSELHSSAHEAGLQKDQQAHEADMATGQQEHEQTMQAEAPQPAAGGAND